ncbi:MAG: hypothetical protein GF355_06255 [Candidatus Eisenbacteria bacterium]|nr:hypothetical protein [Candidatus Eisenbacteria bacterium]
MERFHADYNLKRLARWLRAAGCDVSWQSEPRPLAETALRSRQEGRILLTRSQRGLDYPGAPQVLVLYGESTAEQLLEIFRQYGVPDPARRFTRCTLCNGVLQSLDWSAARSRMPRSLQDEEQPVWICPDCNRLYWEGTHVASMSRVLDEAARGVLPSGGETVGLRPARSSPSSGQGGRRLRETQTARHWTCFDAFLRDLFGAHHFSWRGFRRKRRSLRSRIMKRMSELGLATLDAYRERIETDPRERARLHEILAVTVTRFFRDREEWLRLEGRFDELAGGSQPVAWSVGCAGGEEPYTLSILWRRNRPDAPPLSILATDIAASSLQRARKRRYDRGAVHSVPEEILEEWFTRLPDGRFELHAAAAEGIAFERRDLLRDPWPPGPFDLILCRNFVFTYLEDPLRCELGRMLVQRLRPGGLLMIGSNDRLPAEELGLQRVEGVLYRRSASNQPE